MKKGTCQSCLKFKQDIKEAYFDREFNTFLYHKKSNNHSKPVIICKPCYKADVTGNIKNYTDAFQRKF